MVLNKIETFTCNVIDGIPAPVVNWKLNDDTILTEYAKLTKTLIENNNKTIASYTSRLELKGSFNLDAKSLQCFVEHPMLNTIMTSEKIALNIDCNKILYFFSIFYVITHVIMHGHVNYNYINLHLLKFEAN